MCLTLLVRLLLLLILSGLGLYLLGVWLFRDPFRPDEIHYVKASDGWEIGMRRIRPKNKTPKATPILLQHGLGANHRDFDLDERNSLARFLARAGYDCFLPDMRGVGLSGYLRWGHPDRWHIGFEDFVEKDLPAAIDRILQLTGAEKLHYIGHSMGALVGYALAGGEAAAKMKSLTSFAGPAMFNAMGHFKPLLRFQRLLSPFPVLHMDIWNCLLAPLAYLFPIIGGHEVNHKNMERRTLAKAAANVIAPIPRRLLQQFAAWVEFGDWGSHRAQSYQQNLSNIRIPLYCLVGGGGKDFFCPIEAIEPVYRMAASELKQFRVFSVANGHVADYGHGDISVGRRAPEEIFPTVLEWLEKVDAGA